MDRGFASSARDQNAAEGSRCIGYEPSNLSRSIRETETLCSRQMCPEGRILRDLDTNHTLYQKSMEFLQILWHRKYKYGEKSDAIIHMAHGTSCRPIVYKLFTNIATSHISMFTQKNCNVLLHLECQRLLRRLLQVQLYPESLETPMKIVSKQTRKTVVAVKCVALL